MKKLSRFEMRLLATIDSAYPFPYEQEDGKQIVLIGERPLESLETLQKRHGHDCSDAVSTLLCFKYVSEFHLYDPNCVGEQSVHGGKRLRLPLTGPGQGITGYQITERGQKLLNSRLRVRAVGFTTSTLQKVFSEKLTFLLVFVFGALFGKWLPTETKHEPTPTIVQAERQLTTLEDVMIDNGRRILEYAQMPAVAELHLMEKEDMKLLKAIIDNPNSTKAEKSKQVIEWITRTEGGTKVR